MSANTTLKGPMLYEGKTKVIWQSANDPDTIIAEAKNDITAGDGAMHDKLSGKAVWATTTTCNVFRLLRDAGIPVAFHEQLDPVSFSAPLCTMLKLEVVLRREAHGSYIDRNPHMSVGSYFPKLVFELFLKTSGKMWKNHDLVKDDPLMKILHDKVELYKPGLTKEERKMEPKGSLVRQQPFLVLPHDEVFEPGEFNLLTEIEKIARRVFFVLEKAWALLGSRFVDLKIEFGLDSENRLLVADVIDNDSWRKIEPDGSYGDKQVYRDGGSLELVQSKYALAAEMSKRFQIPQQLVVVWRGSVNDDVSPIQHALSICCEGLPFVVGVDGCFDCNCFDIVIETMSMHKQPVLGVHSLHKHIQKVPDAVVIAFIGHSNGAGPTLSAACSVPVIMVPANFEEYPEDVWSSLRTPSGVPAATVINPKNAALLAVEILAGRNPHAYMYLRELMESKMTNFSLL